MYSDNVDYANKSWYLNGSFQGGAGATGSFYFGYLIKNWGFNQTATDLSVIYFNSNRQTGSQNLKFSSNETRPKSKFFSLLIYAGYPA